MSGFEDELRAALREHAQAVVLPPDLHAKLDLRARGLRRRRAAGRLVAATGALVLVGFGVPVLTHSVETGRPYPVDAQLVRSLRQQPLASGLPRLSTPSQQPGHPSALPTVASALPANYLDWNRRGRRPPPQLISFTHGYYANRLEAPQDVRVTPLWSGQVNDGAWITVVQAYSATGGSTSPALIGVFMSDEHGDAPHAVAGGALYFRHAGPGEDPASVLTDMQRVWLFTVQLPGNQLLAVGSPDVTSIWYAADGTNFVQQKAVTGVALFPRAARRDNGIPVDLVQARDATGTPLTPPDDAAARYARNLGQNATEGWGLADIS